MNDTPDTGGYMVAAYIAAAVILLIYVATLAARAKGPGRDR